MSTLAVYAPGASAGPVLDPTERRGSTDRYTTEASELGLPPGRWPHELEASHGVESLTLRLTGMYRGPQPRWDAEIMSVTYEAPGVALEVWND